MDKYIDTQFDLFNTEEDSAQIPNYLLENDSQIDSDSNYSLTQYQSQLLSPSESEDSEASHHPTCDTIASSLKTDYDEIKVLSLKRKLPAAAIKLSPSENEDSEASHHPTCDTIASSPNDEILIDSESTQLPVLSLKGELPAAEEFSQSILKKPKKGRCTFKFHKACQNVSSGEFYTFSKSVYTGAVVTSGGVNEKATQTIIGGRILLMIYN